MKKTLFYMLTLFFTIIGIFLFSMARQGIDYGIVSQDKIQVYVTSKTTLQKIVTEEPETSIFDEKTNTVQVPSGTVFQYINVFQHKMHVANAVAYKSTPHFSLKLYVIALKTQASNYLKGDFGSIYIMNEQGQAPITKHIGVMIKRSLGYLIPGFFLAVLLGVCMALLASITSAFAKIMDAIHAVFVTIPDFFLIALIWIMAIFLSKFTTNRLVLVVQFNNEVPFLIPFLTISLIPCVLIYGTMRIALRREWATNYVKTALAKGLTATYIVRKHLLRNTWEDLLTVLPKAFTMAVASMAIAEVLCTIVGLGGFMKNPYFFNINALPFTSMVLGGIIIAFHLMVALVRKWLVVRVKEADE